MSLLKKNRSRWDKPSIDARISWIEKNPLFKRAGSAAGMRFSRYHGSTTVSEYLERGGTWADLKYDEDHRLLTIIRAEAKTASHRSGDTPALIPIMSGGIYVVTLNNIEPISTQAHDRRFDDKAVLKVNRENRKFGKALDFNGRERLGYYKTFGEHNVNFRPIVATEPA